MKKISADEQYREKLIEGGVRPDRIAGLLGRDLNCVGNIVGIYRTSMAEQNPAAFEIEQYRRLWRTA